MFDFKKLQETDPLKRMVEKQTEQEEFSPMNPPDAYSPPAGEAIPYENLPPFLKKFVDEHRRCLSELEAFEGILSRLHRQGLKPDKTVDKGLRRFFSFLDESIVRHNLKEEKILFPLLQKRLLEKGEHSKGQYPKTAVDMLEDDHITVMQLAAVTFNFLGLAARLPDAPSRAITLDAALEQGKELVELLRLHIFREDNVVFPLAVKHIAENEFRELEAALAKFDQY
ncbi:MAG: hemerythrin domain-containing protein [Calditrichaceae bacterium]|nr:hemerythrin domain-containing protein [Calditrichia bacterium]NUQ42426.1 hemerythrin domain-containing protein [Calditrichaceae bacterium]